MSRLECLLRRVPPRWRRGLRRLPGADRAREIIAGSPRRGEKRPVVYLPTWVRWDHMRQRPQYLLAAFAAAGHPVYFVDPLEPQARQVDGVRIVPDVSQAPTRGAILYVHFAPMRHMFELFEDPVIVYDILDDLSIYDADEVDVSPERRVAAHHPAVMREAHVVVVSNRVLAETHRPERYDLIVVENGVDPDRFGRPAPRPSDLPREAPIVGYHGAVSYWFDFPLLEEVARLRPEWRFVLVGPVDPRVGEQAERLAQASNVTLLGERPPDAMPGYVQAFDVGSIWFEVTDMTRGVTPLKMYEYLAAGKGCVSTPLPACVEAPEVRTASDPDAFVAELEAELASAGDPGVVEARRRAARAHSWEARLEPALRRLAELGLDTVR